MSTTDILGRQGADLQSTDERARAAVKVFHRMQPALSAYARALTGKADVQVVVSQNSNGHTDGKKIFFRPPLALGDNTPHQRKLCDRRDPETMIQLCPACAVREQVLIVIYHEIGHIVFGSFEVMSENERAEALKYGLSLVDKKYAEAVMAKVRMAPDFRKSTYIGMASLISPFLPGIVNALEDARVNREAADARKGTRIMFQVDTMRVLSEGFEQRMPDGTFRQVYWNERPLNAQMICAVYARFAGYKMEDFFVPEVVAALDDPKCKAILRNFHTVRNARGVYALSIDLLMRLRELGFYQHETDPQVENEPNESEDQPQEENEDDGSDDSGDAKTPEQSADGDEGSEHEAGDSEGSEGSDKGETGSGSPEEQGESSSAGDADTDSDGEGEQGLDKESDSTDAGFGNEESESGNETESSGDGSEGGSDVEPSFDESGSSDGGDQSKAKGEDYNSEASDAPNGNQGGELDEPESSTDATEPSVQGDGSGESPEGSGTNAEENSNELEDGGEDASRTRSDYDSSEAGSDVQGLDNREVLDTDALGESGADSRDDLDSNSDDGDSSDSVREENDTVPDEAVDERGDTTPNDVSPDHGETVQPKGREVGEDEAIDSGADEGLGGVEVIEDSAFDRLPMGTPEEVNGTIHEIAHPEERPDHIKEEASAGKEMDRAIVQGLYFETPSRHVFGVREHYYDNPVMVGGINMSQGWDTSGYSHWGYSRKQLGIEGDFTCEEAILGPALLKMRVAFADNKRGHDMRNRKSGKVDARVLGKRVHFNDTRLFKKRSIPGKKDYFVLIGIDISGSTIGENIMLAKRAAMAQAELCFRSGITFAVYAHSGNYHEPEEGRIGGLDMDIYHIKDPDEPWTDATRERLSKLAPDSVNLDGHTFEYYRKILDKRPETDKVMLYYTDGKMPAENHDEELIILKREIKICRQKKYVLMGVGIRTNSPVQHGLDTVEVNTDEDLVKVVQHLEKRLLEIK